MVAVDEDEDVLVDVLVDEDEDEDELESELLTLTEVASSVDMLCKEGGALAFCVVPVLPVDGVLVVLSDPPPPQATRVSVLAVTNARPRRWAHRGTALSGSGVRFKYGMKVLQKRMRKRIVWTAVVYPQPAICHGQCHPVYLVRCMCRASAWA